MKSLSRTIGINFLWGLSTLFSFCMVFILREFLVIAMETLAWDKYTVNVVDKLLILVIGIITVACFLYIQHVYVHKNSYLFFLVTSIQLLLYGAIKFLQVVLINFQFPILQVLDYLLLLLMVGLSLASFLCYLSLKRKSI